MTRNSKILSASRPQALLSRRFALATDSARLDAAVENMTDNLASLLAEAGVEATRVNAAQPPHTVEEALIGKNILFVMGGTDVDPQKYGQPNSTDTLYGLDALADQYEIELIQQAIAARMTVVGICRGMQVLNVACGGTLVQDLGNGSIHNSSADNMAFVDHLVQIHGQGRLATALGEAEFEIRSGHHQAVDKLGRGFCAIATAQDDVVEAIELDAPNWVFGVQWHPEAPGADLRQIRKLLRAVVQSTSV